MESTEMQHFLNLLCPESTSYYSSTTAYTLEKHGKFEVKVELPGVKKEDISIHIENVPGSDVFILKVEYGTSEPKHKCSTRLIGHVEIEKITATYENGLLWIIIPKRNTVTHNIPITINQSSEE
jgi:HSP20 family molecular chaperone IbpA